MRTIPRVPPTQIFPSRSSNSALTAPIGNWPSSQRETDLPFIRSSPRAVPIQRFKSRSCNMLRIWALLKGEGNGTAVYFVPAQRNTPLSVPSQTWSSLGDNKQLILVRGNCVPTFPVLPWYTENRPEFSVPSQIL